MSDDSISRAEAIAELKSQDPSRVWDTADVEVWINTLPPAKTDQFADSGKMVDHLREGTKMVDAMRWIPCEEQLPEENGHYIVTVHPDYLVPHSLGVDVLIWYDKKWQYLDIDGFADFPDPIVAWMPLPEPYREGGEEG